MDYLPVIPIGNTGKSQANFHLGRQHGVAATIGSNL